MIVSAAKPSSLFSDIAEVAILLIRVVIRNSTPTIASRLVKTTARIRAEPTGDVPLRNSLFTVLILANYLSK
jgi:hypothetical protein